MQRDQAGHKPEYPTVAERFVGRAHRMQITMQMEVRDRLQKAPSPDKWAGAS